MVEGLFNLSSANPSESELSMRPSSSFLSFHPLIQSPILGTAIAGFSRTACCIAMAFVASATSLYGTAYAQDATAKKIVEIGTQDPQAMTWLDVLTNRLVVTHGRQ